jgi:formate hydrogenlyase subunit 3/multisubunit Na+/H+ antiporter MnhD subunit
MNMIEYLLLAFAFLAGFSYRKQSRLFGIFFLLITALFSLNNPIVLVFITVAIISLLLNKDIQQECVSLTLFLVAGSIGIINSGNMFTIYIFFELALLASYFLLFKHSREHIMALSRYFVMNSIGTAFILFGLAMLWSELGTFSISQLSPGTYAIFLFIGFATKMGMVPFHMWLPRNYDVLDTGHLILFAAILSKIGVIGISKFLPAIGPDLAMALAIAAIFSMTVANMSAIVERNIKRLLAYSSIAQMSYILFGFLAGASLGATIHIVGHTLAITCSLICAGILIEKFGTKDLKKLLGAATANSLLAFGFLVSILCLAGMPLLPLFISELFIFIGSFSYSPLLAAAFGFNLILSVAYYINLIRIIELKQVRTHITLTRNQSLAILLLTCLLIILGIMPGILVQALS